MRIPFCKRKNKSHKYMYLNYDMEKKEYFRGLSEKENLVPWNRRNIHSLTLVFNSLALPIQHLMGECITNLCAFKM